MDPIYELATLNLAIELPEPGENPLHSLRARIIGSLLNYGMTLPADITWGLVILPGLDGEEFSTIAGTIEAFPNIEDLR